MSLIFSFVKLGSDVMPADLQEANKESKVSQSFPNHSKALEVPETVLDDAWTTGGTLGWGSAGQGWGQLLTQVAFELSVFLPQPAKCLGAGIHHHTQLTGMCCGAH